MPPGGLSKPGRYERHVYVYVPKQYVPGTPAPFMVVQDGHGYVKRMVNDAGQHDRGPSHAAHGAWFSPIPAAATRKAPSAGWNTTRSRTAIPTGWNRNCCRRVTQRYGVSFTTDPEGRGTMGGSSGGAAAFTMAWFHPELYHKVLSLFRHLREPGLAGRSRRRRAAAGNITII